MTVQPEVPRHNPDNEPLREELQARFDSLLRTSAEQLELFAAPDRATFITRDARFGRYGEDILDIEHTIESRQHYVIGSDHKNHRVVSRHHVGSVNYLHSEDKTKTFCANYPGNNTNQHLWRVSDRQWYGEKLLQNLNENWPHYDDFDREDLKKRIFDKDNRVESQYIFDTLETYALRNQTGARSYNLEWEYSEAVSNFIGQECVDSIALKISNQDLDSHGFHKITATHTMPYRLNGHLLELTTVITTDEFNNVSIESWYPHPETDKRCTKRIANYDEYLRELGESLEMLISEKSDL